MIALITILLALIYGFIILRREVLRDFQAWKVGDYYKIDHGRGWRRRAMINIPTIAGLTIGLNPQGYALIWAPLVSTGLVMVVFWLCFDGWFNNIRRFNYWYTGTNDPNDAHTDDIIQGLRKWQHIALKIGLVTLFTILYLIILF